MSGSAYDSVPPAVRAQWAQLNNFDNPPRHVRMIIPVTIVLGISVILIVGARFWVRVFVQRKVDIADWLIFIVTACRLLYIPIPHELTNHPQIPTLLYLSMVCLGGSSSSFGSCLETNPHMKQSRITATTDISMTCTHRH